MNDEEALIRALIDTPDDAGIRSVFSDWLEEQGATGGVARLWFRHVPAPARTYTFVYSVGKVVVAISTHGLDLRRSLPRPGFLNEAEDPHPPRWKVIAAERCKAVENWEGLRDLALAARGREGSSSTDRTTFRHTLWGRVSPVEGRWDDPAPTPLVSIYYSLIALAGLLPRDIAEILRRSREGPVR
jgi:uncharacterized protein (TIGR02996 family)